MTQQYDALEGTLSVTSTATASRTGDTNAVALVGGYDAANASNDVTAGETTLIEDSTNADQTFGDSELARAAQAASANGVGTLYGVPVAETETTESFTGSQSLSLTDAPVFDPSVHPDHEITVTDTSAGVDLTTNLVYGDTVATPSESETANVNPITGTIETDASSDYDVTYTHGDYSGAISTAAGLNVRYVAVLTEAASVKSTLITELADRATDFDFKRGITGARPNIDATEAASYTPNQQNWRLIEVAPSRGTGASGSVRTAAAIAGHFASQPIGPDGSGLYEPVNGLTALETAYRPSYAKEFNGVTAITEDGVVGTAKTTSTEKQFEDVYATEIIDAVALGLFDVARDYAGGPQDVGDLQALLMSSCQGFSRGNPPLLGFARDTSNAPYDINVTLGADSSVANAGVTIVPYPIAEEVNLSLTVSDGFVQFGGASA